MLPRGLAGSWRTAPIRLTSCPRTCESRSTCSTRPFRLEVPRFLFLGSSCIYPKFAEQPIREDSLLTGPLEPTNDAYAIAKIAGIMQVQAIRRQYGLSYISAMPTNLYGPGDNFHPQNSHVLPALIRRFHEARQSGAGSVTCWGTGTPRREFLHVDDLAAAAHFLLENYDSPETVNVGTGIDQSIAEIADLVAETTGYDGRHRMGLVEARRNAPETAGRQQTDRSRLEGADPTGSRPRRAPTRGS